MSAEPDERDGITTTQKPAKAMRISGTGYKKDSPALQCMAYKKYNRHAHAWEIDTQAIKAVVSAYLAETENGYSDSGEESGALSRVGLRRKLDINRETYALWLAGYADRDELEDAHTVCNTALSDALRTGDDAIIQQLVENNDKGSATKVIRLLETYGELAAKDSRTVNVGVKMDLGGLKSYGV